jgi:hypothetical protein
MPIDLGLLAYLASSRLVLLSSSLNSTFSSILARLFFAPTAHTLAFKFLDHSIKLVKERFVVNMESGRVLDTSDPLATRAKR